MIANVEAEKAILGAALLRREWFDDAARSIRAEDFSLDSNRRIFARMTALAEAGESVDMVTLVSELDRRKELSAVGDVGYVSSLLDGVPDSAPSVSSYTKLVKQSAQTRALVAAAQLAVARAEAGESPTT